MAEWDAYESTAYHQPTDDMSLPLRWDVAARWAEYVRGMVEGAANARSRPAWYADDVLGRLFTRRRPSNAAATAGTASPNVVGPIDGEAAGLGEAVVGEASDCCTSSGTR